MKYVSYEIVFQEVPCEISLAFSIAGCNIKCKDCHSKFLWEDKGKYLTCNELNKFLNKYSNYISCVLFYGGEWHEKELIEYLKICKDEKLKTCLYTGLDDVNDNIKKHLNYLKTGPFIKKFGPLTSPTTNQRFYNLDTNSDITNHFWR